MNPYLVFVVSYCYRYQSKTKDPIHLLHGCRIVCSYFGSGHGKGVHNGAGVVLKHEIKKNK